ncbi:MAG TPA: hypothetical protein VMH77_04445 [Steroidobacteraceae bacterium]|nr:hypothetical protein [Steroidobacteraceae bacterium]
MNIPLQYGIVFLAVAAAGWSAWRRLRGRRVFGAGIKDKETGSCANCSSAGKHQAPR